MRNGGGIVAEGATAPCPRTPSACSQDGFRDSWSFDRTERRLADVVHGIHDRCPEAADLHGGPGDHLTGATSPVSAGSPTRCPPVA
ncbi:hypothetical protein [Umezawaea beigongshangensis]|uniref:hypothetical protein n=1 Tax=Umezawaea beigongshangensis TaxID=2780383 RepID=UPI003F6885BB